MTLDLDELERMEKAATAGPWTWQREDASMLGLLGPRGEADHVLSTTRCEACQQSGGPCLDPKHADAHLIAALRNAAPPSSLKPGRRTTRTGFLLTLESA